MQAGSSKACREFINENAKFNLFILSNFLFWGEGDEFGAHFYLKPIINSSDVA